MPNIVFYRTLEFEIDPDVYVPAEDTFLIADNLNVKKGEHVLELGTGCGLIAVLAAKAGGKVIATDINPSALKCARKNALRHGVANLIDFRLGDLFLPVSDEKFDLILFNPPYLPVLPEETIGSPLDLAWEAGPDGRYVLNRFLKELPNHLAEKGRVMFVQSSLSDVSKTLQFLKTNSFKVKITTKKLPFEELYLLCCVKQ